MANICIKLGAPTASARASGLRVAIERPRAALAPSPHTVSLDRHPPTMERGLPEPSTLPPPSSRHQRPPSERAYQAPLEQAPAPSGCAATRDATRASRQARTAPLGAHPALHPAGALGSHPTLHLLTHRRRDRRRHGRRRRGHVGAGGSRFALGAAARARGLRLKDVTEM